MRKLFLNILVVATLVSSGCQNKKRELEKITTTNTQKEASHFTKKTNDAILNSLPFEDNADFENARKGFIATIESGEILDAEGKLIYSMKEFDFIKGKAPSTTNPSLWRQCELNSINGLFEVTDGVYQIRGFDLANMSLIRGQKGWILVDPLYSAETAKAGLDLANEKLGERPVTAVIITHSHIDHFGGIRGVVDEADVISGKVPIYVPEGFFDKSINENVMGGNTMLRRATYMFGRLLPKEPKGNIGSGLGQYLSSGQIGILDGTDIINELSGEKRIIDGMNVEFIYTPEAEAPSEMMVYFNDYKSLCQAEIINHTLHNLYTLRGAKVRNGQKWSQYIDLAIAKWGDEVTSSFGSHHWPTWGNQSIKDYWKSQRDLYRFIHDQTLRLANNGYTPIEIAEMLKLPESMDKEFPSRGYYGTASHNSRAQYQLYFGWFDGNPANLNKLTPEESGKKYVEFMGGPEALLSRAQESYNQGDYRWVAEVVNHLVFADSKNQDARNLLADTYEQLGYVAESGPWRNFYLSGAKELRNRLKFPPTTNIGRPDFIKGMSLEQFFNFMAMKFIGTDHDASQMNYNFNFVFPDVKEKAVLLVSNGVVTPRIGSNLKEDVTATISIKRSDLDRISLGEAKYPELVENGTVQIDGDSNAFYKFLGKLDSFNLWFNIIEP